MARNEEKTASPVQGYSSRRRFFGELAILTGGTLLAGNSPFARRYSYAESSSKGTELWRMSAAELAVLVRLKKVSAREIVEAHIRRIKVVNPEVNAVTSILERGATAEAGIADETRNQRGTLSPLWAIPFSVKENIDVAGLATTEGVRFLENNIADVDSPHVELMRRNGAIPVARTNMPDFGLRFHTENDLRGATLNPWDPALTPGGSSGGDAVAVATGMVPIGLGNDYGGSLRFPAQCCGICSLRPSRGRIPFFAGSLAHGYISHSLRMFAVQGPLARRVIDLRMALDAMSSFDSRDPAWVPAPLQEEKRIPWRIALITDPGNLGADQSVKAAVKKAGQILEGKGCVVEETDSHSLLESSRLWAQIVAADIRSLFMPTIRENASRGAIAFLDEFLALNPRPAQDEYVSMLARANSIAQSWGEFFAVHDAVLGPVSSRNPFRVGFDIEGTDRAKSLLDSTTLMVTVNLLGLPSVAVPVGMSDGLPQAVQIIGPRFKEYRCLDLAQVIEDEVGIFTPVDPSVNGNGR